MSAFQRTRGDGCLSDLRIDRLIRHELAPDAEAESRQHLGGCESCRARVAEVEAARATHQASAPPLRRPAPRRRWGAWAGASTALAAAAAFVIFLRTPPDGTRLKGGPGVRFFVQHAGQLRQGQSGERVAPGDTLQLDYSSAKPFYGAILSLDGAQHASRYFPDGPRAARLDAGTQRSFPTSTVLDDTLGRETVFVLFCDDPIALEPMPAALAAPGCHVERFELDKR